MAKNSRVMMGKKAQMKALAGGKKINSPKTQKLKNHGIKKVDRMKKSGSR